MSSEQNMETPASAPSTKPANSKQLLLSTLTTLESVVRTANSLPSTDNLQFACTTYPPIDASFRATTRHLLATLRSISARYDVKAVAIDAESDDADSVGSITSFDEVYEEVGNTTEESLEQFNAALDDARGIQDAVYVDKGGIGPEFRVVSAVVSNKQQTCVEMQKPQKQFHDYPIDNSDTPFVSSYGAVKGGDGEVGLYLQDLFKANSNGGGAVGGGLKHPYEEENLRLAAEMGGRKFKEKETIVYGDLEKTKCTFVESESELLKIVEKLKKVNEIAVDIENHSMRSFQGFTCLIQISTRREDFVIDALKLRACIHRALAPVFTDERTVKVMHGADKDVQWLERDFGIYVVNMFDTGQAARVLKLPSAGLSYLLARFCSIVNLDKKKFQLADWRQRPLSKEMYEYARSDTHYLLYVYDRLRTELGKKDRLAKVWERSAAVTRKRHTKTRFDPGMARHLAAKYGLGFDQHQMRLLEELYRWRDRKAREEDESLNYVAPVRTLFGIVRVRDHGRTVKGLLQYGFPSNKSIPPMVKSHAEELVRLICDALDAKLEPEKDAASKKEVAQKQSSSAMQIGTSEVLRIGNPSHTVAEITAAASKELNRSKREKKRSRAEVSDTKSLQVDVLAKKMSGSLNANKTESESEDGDDGKYSAHDGKGDRVGEVQNGIEKTDDMVVEAVRVIDHEQNIPKVPPAKLAPKSVFEFSSDEEGDDETGQQGFVEDFCVAELTKGPRLGRVEEHGDEVLSRDGWEQNGNTSKGTFDNSRDGGDHEATGKHPSGVIKSLSGPLASVKESVDRVRLSAASKSVFDMSSDEEDDIVIGTRDCEKDNHETEIRENGIASDGENGNAVLGSGKLTTFSLINGARKDVEGGKEESKAQVLARVRASMTEFAPLTPAGFRVETDKVEEEGDGVEDSEKGEERGVDGKRMREEKKEEKVLSLLEAYGEGDSGRKKKKRKKGKKSEKVAERLPAFDYVEERKMEKERKKGEGAAFDPLQKLRHDWKDKKGRKKARKVKKRPGSGVRSMSFKAK